MVSLLNQTDFRAVQNLPFCYLCGKDFADHDFTDKDHVPPESALAKRDREPLLLKTHVACNHRHSATDEKIGQLIALIHGKVPSNPQNRRLQVAHSGRIGMGVVTNLNVDEAIWRWISGFHAALYGEPLSKFEGSLVHPFPRADLANGRYVIVPLREQHLLFVETIKRNRIKNSLDRIRANKGKLTYECVWGQSDNKGPWLCIFALNIYNWKDLGKMPFNPARGCAGCYVMQSGSVPATATQVSFSRILIPSTNPFDPFGG
jgi:hypothetical protein